MLMDVTCPQCTCGGILRGTGNQKVGAIVNAIGYYVIGLPIGIALMFAAKLGVIGKPHCPVSLIAGRQASCPQARGGWASTWKPHSASHTPSVRCQRVSVQTVDEK
jgi:hypothetical protein